MCRLRLVFFSFVLSQLLLNRGYVALKYNTHSPQFFFFEFGIHRSFFKCGMLENGLENQNSKKYRGYLGCIFEGNISKFGDNQYKTQLIHSNFQRSKNQNILQNTILQPAKHIIMRRNTADGKSWRNCFSSLSTGSFSNSMLIFIKGGSHQLIQLSIFITIAYILKI